MYKRPVYVGKCGFRMKLGVSALNSKGVVIAPEELDAQWIRQICRSGIDVVGLHPDPRVNDAETAMRQFLASEGSAMIRELEAHGITVEWHLHALSSLLPRKLFQTHPEWFRMDSNGCRTADHNLCCTSEEALQVVCDSAARLAGLFRPKSHRYYFWLDDVAEGGCHCNACRAYSRADQALRVYNAIARGIRKADPQGMQCYLAYHDTNACPQVIKPADGIFLQYAPFNRDHDKPLDDPDSQRNRQERLHLGQLLAYFGKENAQVLDYWLDNSLFSGWQKPPKEFHLRKNVLRRDLQFYRDLGFRHIMTFACYLGQDYRQLHGDTPDILDYGKALEQP